MSQSTYIPAEERQLQGLLTMLTLQFLVGISLTTLIDYNPSKQSALQLAVLILHIIIAVGLLVGAAIYLLMSIKRREPLRPSAGGLIGVVMAIVAGAIAAGNGSGVAIFFMALGFLIAYTSYGVRMGHVMSLKR